MAMLVIPNIRRRHCSSAVVVAANKAVYALQRENLKFASSADYRCHCVTQCDTLVIISLLCRVARGSQKFVEVEEEKKNNYVVRHFFVQSDVSIQKRVLLYLRYF